MFTGLIESIGVVDQLTRSDAGLDLAIVNSEKLERYAEMHRRQMLEEELGRLETLRRDIQSGDF